MKLWVFSDFQRDLNRQGGFFLPENMPDADVAVIAGDFHPNLHMSVLSLSKLAKEMPIVYVAGNRDFYNGDHDEWLELAKREADNFPHSKGFHLLHNESVVIGDTRFIGSTLWTDGKFGDDPSSDESIARGLSDFRLIKGWTTNRMYAEHAKAKAFITDELKKPFDGPSVVVSHHAPHANSLHVQHQGSPLNAAFISDLTDVLTSNYAPDLWVHGAVHSNHDYTVGGTRVLCNSKGYIGENPDFVSDLVVDTTPAMTFAP